MRQDEAYHLRERRTGAFSRSLMLPSNVQADAIEAHCDNGLLRLHIPEAEEAKPRRIQVRTDTQREVFDLPAGGVRFDWSRTRKPGCASDGGMHRLRRLFGDCGRRVRAAVGNSGV